MRVLWLIYERAGHPDAVCYGATADEARFVLRLLRESRRERTRLAGQLINFLETESKRTAPDRRAVSCRIPGGLYRCVPWRLAKWLRFALPAPESAVDETVARIERWLGQPVGDADFVAAGW